MCVCVYITWVLHGMPRIGRVVYEWICVLQVLGFTNACFESTSTWKSHWRELDWQPTVTRICGPLDLKFRFIPTSSHVWYPSGVHWQVHLGYIMWPGYFGGDSRCSPYESIIYGEVVNYEVAWNWPSSLSIQSSWKTLCEQQSQKSAVWAQNARASGPPNENLRL